MTTLAALASGTGASLVLGQTAQERSDVVLVFDVSDSILESEDGTNLEFADALDDIADRVAVVANDLASGNASISFVAFARDSIAYPPNCAALELNGDPAAIERFEACLRSVADEYRAGVDAPVRDQIRTGATDHVAALRGAAALLPDTSSRAAVIFFTDGEHDPPGTARDDEDVLALVTPAFEGRTPLAVLPVGLGSGAGAFEADLTAIYEAFFRDMEPCTGRQSFSWPEVVFPSADAAGAAVALALQEVTCSFTVAPTPTPTEAPTPTPVAFGQPLGITALAGNGSITVQWLAPSDGGEQVTDYLVRCTAATGGEPIESTEGISTVLQAEVSPLQAGVAYSCEVAATDGVTIGPWSAASQAVIVLGTPSAPSQPRAEPLDASARLTVDPATGAPVEQYVYECTTGAGAPVTATGSTPTVVVSGLTNGATYQCVAFAESSVGRSPASPASASFSPCAGLLGCNPWAAWVISGLVLAALLGAAALFAQRYRRRNRSWITAQVDGGENRPLGWGPELGVRIDQDEHGWFARPLPPDDAALRVRYRGDNRFVVTVGTRAVDVHQGDPAAVRDDAGAMHSITLRRYRDRPDPSKTTRAGTGADAPGSEVLRARLPGREDAPEDRSQPPG